jgi:chemotaxis protein MotA
MDLATCIGLLAAFGMFFWALWTGSQGQIGAFWDTASALLVIGGAVFVVLMTQALDKYLAFFSVLKRSFFVRRQTIPATIEQIVRLGEIARREGVLSLENTLSELEDEFLVNGIRLVIDGTSATEIEQILTAELEAIDQRHTQGRGILDLFAKYAPAFGMIGTLMGLVAMLMNMDDPKKIGPGMAVAILTTFYGAVIANMICLPLADKLSYRHEEEMLVRTIILKGILSLQAGDNPRITQAKLAVFMPAGARHTLAGLSGDRKPADQE